MIVESTVNKFTPAQYEAAIPKTCRLTTMDAHVDIMLCWGLANSIRTNTPMNCGWCEENSEHTREEWLVWYKNDTEQRKIWRILND